MDARSNRNSFMYDAAGQRLVWRDSLNRRTSYTYDDAGRQTLRIDARTYRTTYTYDALNQLTARRYPDGSRHTFAYDPAGNRTLAANDTGRYTTAYDSLNRPHQVTNPASKTITYSYDANGDRRSLIDPDGGRFTYAYDAARRITLVQNPQGDRTTFTYDEDSRRTLKRLANGTRTSWTYDNAAQITGLYHFKSDGSTIGGFDYAYDDAGNRTRVVEANGDRVTWSYDATYQLTNERRSGAHAYDTTYVYDPVGNRTLKMADGVRTTYAYDAANQLTYSEDAGGRTTYTFDSDGNQERILAPNGDRTTYTWDYENRMTSAQLPTGIRNTMAYDPDGLRVRLDESSGTKKFVWDGQNYLAETDAANDTGVTYTNEPQLYGHLVSQRRGNASRWYHLDTLGSTRELTNSSAIVTDTRLYDAWGNVIATSGSTASPLRWVGGMGCYYDLQTELYYIRARLYHPYTMRWLSTDPVVSAVVKFEFYRYAENRPTFFVDSTGRAAAQAPPPGIGGDMGYGYYCGPGRNPRGRCIGNTPDWGNLPWDPIDLIDEACLVHDCCLRTTWDFLSGITQCRCNIPLCYAAFKGVYQDGCLSSPLPQQCIAYSLLILASPFCVGMMPGIPFVPAL